METWMTAGATPTYIPFASEENKTKQKKNKKISKLVRCQM